MFYISYKNFFVIERKTIFKLKIKWNIENKNIENVIIAQNSDFK